MGLAVKKKFRDRKRGHAFQVNGVNGKTALSPEGSRAGKNGKTAQLLTENAVYGGVMCVARAVPRRRDSDVYRTQKLRGSFLLHIPA
jgi:hypothetical protein